MIAQPENDTVRFCPLMPRPKFTQVEYRMDNYGSGTYKAIRLRLASIATEVPEATWVSLDQVNTLRNAVGGDALVNDDGYLSLGDEGATAVGAVRLLKFAAGGPETPTDRELAEGATYGIFITQQWQIEAALELFGLVSYGFRKPHHPANQNT